jgi:hypothetical protein
LGALKNGKVSNAVATSGHCDQRETDQDADATMVGSLRYSKSAGRLSDSDSQRTRIVRTLESAPAALGGVPTFVFPGWAPAAVHTDRSDADIVTMSE